MKYALIGCGRVAPNHIKAVLFHRLELIALCDVAPAHMDELLARCAPALSDSVERYTDYRALVDAHPELELVAIATESGYHAEIALYCIEHGIHVIIEKPIAMNMADARRIVEAAKQHHVKVSACHQNRFNTAVQQMRTALEEGRFGRLSHGSIQVRWHRGPEYYAQAPWRGTWALDGGTLMNQCIHGIDLLRWMMGGEIDEVYGVTAQQFHPYMEAEDLGMAVVRFKNGAVATIEGTTNVYRTDLEETLSLFGENGTVKLGGKSVNRVDVWDFADHRPDDETSRGLDEKAENVYGNGHTSLYGDVINAIREDREPYVSAADGMRALELVLAVYQSAAEGRPVKLPLEDCDCAGFRGRFGK